MAGEELAIAVGWAQMMTMATFVLFCTTVVFGGLLAAILKMTPAMTFFKAKLKGMSILMAIRRDRIADFVLGKYSAGIIETKKYGDYIIDPDGVMNENKSGKRMFIASTELGSTMSVQVAKMIQGFQDAGIPNLRIAKLINFQLHHCNTCKADVLADYKQKTEKGRDGNDITVNWFECPACKGKDMKKKDLESEGINIETLKFEKLSKWSDTIMNPIYQSSNKELKVQEAMQDISKPKINLLITFVGIGIMLFLLLLGVSILLPHLTGTAVQAAASNPVTDIVNQTAGGIMKV